MLHFNETGLPNQIVVHIYIHEQRHWAGLVVKLKVNEQSRVINDEPKVQVFNDVLLLRNSRGYYVIVSNKMPY